MSEALLDRLNELLQQAEEEQAEETAEELRILIEDYESGIFLD